MTIIAASSVRYPDAVVTCSNAEGWANIVPEHVVVFAILSPSTASVDRVTKSQEYRATPSIERYVMLEQTRIAATVFARRRQLNWYRDERRDDARHAADWRRIAVVGTPTLTLTMTIKFAAISCQDS